MLTALNNFIEEYQDARVNDYFIASSTWIPFIIVASYLVFVKILGPWYMENRKPYNVKKWIIAFNWFQIITNAYLVVMILTDLPVMDSNYCLEVDITNDNHLRCSYIYLLLKFSDMLDTVFFVLKKNYHQVSHLHVCHHACMILFCWLGFKIVPGGQSIILGVCNCITHTVMYSYYLLSTYNEKYKKNLAMKRFVTQVQLTQLIFLLSFYIVNLTLPCRYPKFFSLLGISLDAYLVYLFGKFYIATYWKHSEDQSTEIRRNGSNSTKSQ